MVYKFNLPTTPEQLTGTGMIVVEWSYLESILALAIGSLAGLYSNDAIDAVTAQLSYSMRIQTLGTLVSLHHDRKLREEFSVIASSLEDLYRHRNAVVHGKWVRGSKGSPMIYAVKARGKLQRTTTGKSADEMRRVAGQIAELADRLRVLFEIEAK